MNTHKTVGRRPRDIPCTAKDLDLALDATRQIELNHERIRQKRLYGTGMNTTSMNQSVCGEQASNYH